MCIRDRIQPETIKNNNQVIVTANMDGQGNYFFYGKKPGDTITLRVPKTENYTCLLYTSFENFCIDGLHFVDDGSGMPNPENTYTNGKTGI